MSSLQEESAESAKMLQYFQVLGLISVAASWIHFNLIISEDNNFSFFFISFIFLSWPKWLKLYAVYTTCHVVSLSSVYLSRHISAGLLSY